MKRLLSILLLGILLTTAVCSCRSSKESATEYSGADTLTLVGSASTLTKDDLLSIISASRELDLSGFRLEFYPPDPAHPDARAAPKALSIEAVEAKETTDQTSHAQAMAVGQKTVNLSAQSSTAAKQVLRNDNDAFRPPGRLYLLLAVLAVGIIVYRFRK